MKPTVAIGLAACFLHAQVAWAAESDSLDPAQPYSAERRNPITYDAEIIVTVTAPYKTQRLSVWIPIPPSDRGQELLATELTTFPDEVSPRIGTEPLFGNRFAYFEFTSPQGAQVIRHKFRITVWELRWNLAADRVRPVANWPESFQPYRRSETQAVVADERFEKLLREIVPERHDPLADFSTVLNWAGANLTYDHAQASLVASSAHALELRRGHCSDYHGFCAAMGRLLNQPTRITYGMNAFPKSSPSHCKLEAFLPPFGWVSFDVSETQKLCQAIRANKDFPEADQESLVQAAQLRLTRGFRDNTWFVQTRGTDYDLAPPARSRVPVVRTIYAEADGKPLPDPDPSSSEQSKFAWMTAQRFRPNAPVNYPFTNIDSLRDWTVHGEPKASSKLGASK